MGEIYKERIDYIKEYLIESQETAFGKDKKKAQQYIHYIEGYIDGLENMINKWE